MIEALTAWVVSNSDPANLLALVVIYHRLDKRLLRLRREVTDDEVQVSQSLLPSLRR